MFESASSSFSSSYSSSSTTSVLIDAVSSSSTIMVTASVIVGLLALLVFIFVLLPVILATFYTAFHKESLQKSKLFVGRVWHTRFQPKRHAFTYPIFMFALDLEEIVGSSTNNNNNNDSKLLWPIVKFDESDHLKNGEGFIEGETASSSSSSLVERILNLVAERTNNKCQPTLETHRVVLMTHLTYYGYNFNPVSFYYIIDKTSEKLTAMVGEVSNTPWLEMYPYILHPDSSDNVKCNSTSTKYDYSFPKTFHVSPFMEMNYYYDWTFMGVPTTKDNESITVINSLRSRRSPSEKNRDENDTTSPTPTSSLAFTAKLVVQEQSITPFNIAWQIIRFPIFCMIIQIWIHYEAALLFLKGIVYVPHPDGSETAVSKAIATVMVPFFAIRDKLKPSSKTKTE